MRLVLFLILLNLPCKAQSNKGQSNVLPDWLIKQHQSALSNQYDNYRSLISKYVVVNDSISYCLKKITTGTCEKDFIVTFNRSMEISQYEVGRKCDHDLSRPSYRWKEFKILSDTSFRIVEIVERVPYQFIDKNGMVKEEFDYYEIANKPRDTVTTLLIVDKSGVLNIK
jgi:hypothetical protein